MKEICVLCQAETNVHVNTPVDKRRGYVDGVGQLCPKCEAKVFGYDDKKKDSK